MSITVNGQSCAPPGFRFHPTEEELLNYYLRKKVACEKIDMDVIRDVDLNKLEPWDILEKCRIGSTPQNDWYFFSHKDKKYPTGGRTNRATAAGFWKATGRDKVIYANSRHVGMRKTLVFYKGRAPHGLKSDWIMHEYRLVDEHPDSKSNGSCSIVDASAQEDGWVVCRVFKKKNLQKATESPNYNCTTDVKTHLPLNSRSDGTLDQILRCMGRSSKQETETTINDAINIPDNSCNYQMGYQTSFVNPALPRLVNNSPSTDMSCFSEPSYQPEGIPAVVQAARAYEPEPELNDWATVDRLVASHLNRESEGSMNYSCLDNAEIIFPSSQEYSNIGSSDSGDGDLWTLARSASDITRVSHESM